MTTRSLPARLGVIVAVAVVAAGAVGAASASHTSGPTSLAWVKPAPAPAGWLRLIPRSHTSVLWYPPAMRPIPGDPYSVSTVLKDRNGTFLVYLNGGPKTGNEQMSNWPASRIDHLREERNRRVHEDAHASALPFRGGTGSCVIDDYFTRLKAHHYREIACFVQGRTTASVLVATALASEWPKYGSLLERAVGAWQVR